MPCWLPSQIRDGAVESCKGSTCSSSQNGELLKAWCDRLCWKPQHASSCATCDARSHLRWRGSVYKPAPNRGRTTVSKSRHTLWGAGAMRSRGLPTVSTSAAALRPHLAGPSWSMAFQVAWTPAIQTAHSRGHLLDRAEYWSMIDRLTEVLESPPCCLAVVRRTTCTHHRLRSW